MKCLFEPVRKIELPEDMQARIIRRCRACASAKRAVPRRAAIIAAAIFILACVTAIGAGSAGYFRDIKNASGAVTGTEYLQATEEIDVQARLAGDGVAIPVHFLRPEAFPYREAEMLGADFRITDGSGKVILEGETALFPVKNGQAEIMIENTSLPDGEYTLAISAFTSVKKADQPLRIEGFWEISIH